MLVNRKKYGMNVLVPPKKPSLAWKFMKELFSGLNALLWACGIMCLLSYLAQYFIDPDNVAPDNVSL